jgi:hypothetical protein
MSTSRREKIKEHLTIKDGKWTDKVAFAAAIGLTGAAIWVAYKTFDTVKNKINFDLDFTDDDIDWDGK